MRAHNTMSRVATAVMVFSMAGLPFGLAAAADTETSPQTSPLPVATQQQAYNEPPPASGVPIIAPVTVDGGQLVEISVKDMAQGARIELWGPIGVAGSGSLIAKAPMNGGVAQMMAPRMPGSYWLHYVGAGGEVLGKRTLEVAAVPIALTVGTPVEAGAILQVTWSGPARPGDRFEIALASPEAGGAVVGSTPIVGDATGQNVSRLSAPRAPGTYELRYVTADGAVLRTVKFDVR